MPWLELAAKQPLVATVSSSSKSTHWHPGPGVNKIRRSMASSVAQYLVSFICISYILVHLFFSSRAHIFVC